MANLNKQLIGENHIQDGPLDVTGYPMGKGSSSGANGMQVSKYPCGCDGLKGPITQRARG